MKLKYIVISTLLLFGTIFTSCDDFFNVEPDDVLLEKNYPGSVAEIYSGYMGVSAKVQAVADRAIFLEGLRGDLMEPTQNSTDDILDLYYYNEKESNEFANPQAYYEVILNANDFMYHAVKFYKENPTAMEKTVIDAILSGTLRYKAWAYSMLAKIYGQAIWLDSHLTTYDNILNFGTLLDFDAVFLKCIDLIENGTVIDGYEINGKNDVKWTTIWTGEESANFYCPSSNLLLAEFYLYAGQYQKVLDCGFALIRAANPGTSAPRFAVTKSEYNGEWVKLFRAYASRESLFFMKYDYNNNQTNHIIDYFSSDPSCQYLIRPSQAGMDRFNTALQAGGEEGDKYRGNGITFKSNNGNWEIYKYTSQLASSNELYKNDVPISLCRAATLHLWLSEALVGLGRLHEALVLYDGGLSTYWNTQEAKFEPKVSPTNATDTLGRFDDFPTCLYFPTGDGPCQGVRTRVAMKTLGNAVIKKYPNIKTDSEEMYNAKMELDSLIIDEYCLEAGAEGQALYSMVRYAKRYDKPQAVADRVAPKYADGYKERIHARLMSREWFINRNLE